MSDRIAGASNAAPTPCTSRPMTSSVGLPAAPQPAEASVNSAMPIPNTCRCPSRSPSRAPVMTKIAEVSE
jgi:hypothetical protein